MLCAAAAATHTLNTPSIQQNENNEKTKPKQ